jgi:hypothetical protein
MNSSKKNIYGKAGQKSYKQNTIQAVGTNQPMGSPQLAHNQILMENQRTGVNQKGNSG